MARELPERNVIKATMLPWQESTEDRARLWRIVSASLGGGLLLLFLLNIIPYPEQDRSQAEKIPERIAKMILEKAKENPPPTPPLPDPEDESEDEIEPLVEPEVEPEPAPLPEMAPETQVAEVKESPKQKEPVKQKEVLAAAKEKAKNTGVLAMSNQLSTLSTLTNVARQGNTSLKAAEGSAERNDNDLINQRAQGGSGGVATTEITKQASQQLKDRDTTRIANSSAESEAAEAARNKLRTSEEIRLVFDQNKSAFYSLYKRALRSTLGLQGRIVFNLVISPDGTVVKCEIVSSELNAPELESKLVAKIRMIDFGSKDVIEWEEEYYLDFSPAG